MRKSTICLFVLGLAATAALASASLLVSAQNMNSMNMGNANTSTKKPKPRRPKPKGMTMGRCDNTKQEQADLSGTYKGKINYPDGGMTGDATLTITGNNFTMAVGSATQSGRITAVTTCGYTGATMMFGDLTPPNPTKPPPPPLPAVSLRAKKMGDSITLTSVPGEPRTVSFTSTGTMKAKNPRKHKAKPKAKTGTPPATPPEQ